MSVRKIKFGIFILTFIFNFTTNVLLARDVCKGFVTSSVTSFYCFIQLCRIAVRPSLIKKERKVLILSVFQVFSEIKDGFVLKILEGPVVVSQEEMGPAHGRS